MQRPRYDRQGRTYDADPNRPHHDRRDDYLGFGGPEGLNERGLRDWADDDTGGSYGAGARGMRGAHTGRGPKDYRRSDERIQEEACEALRTSPHVDATGVTVEVADGEVTLAGTVDSRTMKRDAEDAVADVLGVAQVHNRLRVEPAQDAGERQRPTTATAVQTAAERAQADERAPARDR